MNRRILTGLAVVAGCAAVLSFSAIRDLAALCGFSPGLAPLLPIVIDVGAAVATGLWLSRDTDDAAKRYARALALVLLAGSVASNGLSHGLAAYQLTPPWWVVVLVSAIAPAVLGATVHLVVLARPPATTTDQAGAAVGLGSDPAAPADPAPVLPVDGPAPGAAPAEAVVGQTREQHPTPEPGELSREEQRELATGAAARWGRDEIRAGRTAGKKRMGTEFPALSEHFRQVASDAAKDLAAQPPVRAVQQ